MTGRWGYSLPSLPLQPPLSNSACSFVQTNLRTFSLCHAAHIYTITYKNRLLNKSKKTYWCLLQVYSLYGKYETLLYWYKSFLFNKPEKIRAKFAEVKSHLRLRKGKKLPQTYGFAFADHPLLFCGICGCGIECKFAVPSTAKKPIVSSVSVSFSTFAYDSTCVQ